MQTKVIKGAQHKIKGAQHKCEKKKGLDLLTGSLVVKDPKPYPVPRIFVCDPSGTYKEWKAGAPHART